MTEVNAMQIESKLLQNSESGGTQAVMATISGPMVEEYDKLLNSYNVELISINNEKSAVRHERDNFAITAGQGSQYTPGEGEEQEGVSGKLYSKEEYDELNAIADDYGVDLNETIIDGEYFLSEQIIEDVKDKMDSKLQDLNSVSELKMIYFQSLMDSRKQAMLMLSNMISSDNSTKMAIIQNLKG